jgi:UDP-N-acetylmuramoyl-tripeptide--D-alanyl-D-alanine ligase
MQLLKSIIVWILTLESKLIISKYKPFIVAVTGSVGKTSTKDAIYCVLKDHEPYVRKSDKSMNSEIGLPLTVIGAANSWHDARGWLSTIYKGLGLIITRREYPGCLVLELGADHPGDIRRAARWLKPDIAVITRVSALPVHVEFFKSPEAVFEEKASLAASVKPGGTVILFADDEKVMALKERCAVAGIKVLSFGLSEHADIRGIDALTLYQGGDSRAWQVQSSANPVLGSFNFQPTAVNNPVGMSFKVKFADNLVSVSLRDVIGQVYLYPLLAAAAVGFSRGLSVAEISAGLNAYRPPHGRLNLVRGIRASTIIDDTYNSSPDAVRSALEALSGLRGVGAKIAVLGDMMELGKHSAEAHRSVGREVAGTIDRLVTVGQRSRATAAAALQAGMSVDMVVSVDTANEVAAYLSPLIKSGDVILVKGSQSMRMERAVKALMDEPARAGELLVRQERQWLEKR